MFSQILFVIWVLVIYSDSSQYSQMLPRWNQPLPIYVVNAQSNSEGEKIICNYILLLFKAILHYCFILFYKTRHLDSLKSTLEIYFTMILKWHKRNLSAYEIIDCNKIANMGVKSQQKFWQQVCLRFGF